MNVEKIKEYVMDNFDVDMSKKVVIDFYADWCIPCKITGQHLDDIAGQSKLQVVKINVEDSNDIMSDAEISSIPTILVLTPTEHYDKFVGSASAEVLKKFIEGVK